MTRDYPHLIFSKQWAINEEVAHMLGQCEAYIETIKNTPVLPSHYDDLMHVALLKGAQATTAIEGNTLTDDEIERIMKGLQLPPSKEYQEAEVRNLLDAFNVILQEVVHNNFENLISVDLIKGFHAMIGKDLGEHFQAIPGRLRENEVYVAKYRCPDHRDVENLLNRLIVWLKQEFGFQNRKQTLSEIIIQAIITHVYIEWIHPFSDGNGRTGRLIEFYILLRGGNPDITSHILSNHYNQTRNEYYRQLELATKTSDLSSFLKYAITGFRDGLYQTLQKIQFSMFEITWQKMVYDKFDEIRDKKKETFKRQRALALYSFGKTFSINNIFIRMPEIISYYINSNLQVNANLRTLRRDIDLLITMNLLKEEDKHYTANQALLQGMVPRSK